MSTTDFPATAQDDLYTTIVDLTKRKEFPASLMQVHEYMTRFPMAQREEAAKSLEGVSQQLDLKSRLESGSVYGNDLYFAKLMTESAATVLKKGHQGRIPTLIPEVDGCWLLPLMGSILASRDKQCRNAVRRFASRSNSDTTGGETWQQQQDMLSQGISVLLKRYEEGAIGIAVVKGDELTQWMSESQNRENARFVIDTFGPNGTESTESESD